MKVVLTPSAGWRVKLSTEKVAEKTQAWSENLSATTQRVYSRGVIDNPWEGWWGCYQERLNVSMLDLLRALAMLWSLAKFTRWNWFQ